MDYETVSAQLRSFSGGKRWGLGATDILIRAAEQRLGVTLPETYQRFLAEFGWLAIEAWQVYGLGEDLPGRDMDLVAETLAERHDFMPYLPHHMVPVSNDGGGNLSCLDTSRSEPCPVLTRFHETGEFWPEAQDFPAWLSERIRVATDQA